ncbi:conserved Plasmodium protein, unknown function [Plasmodium gallinaceum]|uniref:Uncharacterized protein n=1 Tax=Plasmodium gallinaceum TaxID=5849 RepID=A0A1J1GYS7_PLAGA|nr:conserved Plasmodium protein, unknown function [Plasmodium gallinaceum]CRG96456.1 conserved Plasmodium protein, unknown function [Plasmodium gallinaceum]
MPILKKIFSNYKKDENKNENNEKGYLNSYDNSYALKINNTRIKNISKSNFNSFSNYNNFSSSKIKLKLCNDEHEIGNFEMLENIEKYDINEKYNCSENFMGNCPYYIFENLKNIKKGKLGKKKCLMEKNELINSQNNFHNNYKNCKIKNKTTNDCSKKEINLNHSSYNSLNYLNYSKFIDIFKKKKKNSHKLNFSLFINDNDGKIIDNNLIKDLRKNKIHIAKEKRKSINVKNKLKEDKENCKNLIYPPFGNNLHEIDTEKIDDSLNTINTYRRNYLYRIKYINEDYSKLIKRKKRFIKNGNFLRFKKKEKRNFKMYRKIIHKNKPSLIKEKKKIFNLEDKNSEIENNITDKREVEEKENVFLKSMKEENLNLNDINCTPRENTKEKEKYDYNISMIKCKNKVDYSLYLKNNSIIDNYEIENKNKEINYEDCGDKEDNKKINIQVNLTNDNFILSFNSKNYEEPFFLHPDEKIKESSIHENYLNKLSFEDKSEDSTINIKKLSENKNVQSNNYEDINSNLKNLNEDNANDSIMDNKKNNQLNSNEKSTSDYIIDSYLNNNSDNFTTDNYKIFDFDNYSISESFQTLIKNCDNILKNNIRNNISIDLSECNNQMDSNCELNISHTSKDNNHLNEVINIKTNDILNQKNDLEEINNLKEDSFSKEESEFIKNHCVVQSNSSNKEYCTNKENDFKKKNFLEHLNNNIENINNIRTISSEKRNFNNKREVLEYSDKLENNTNTFCKENIYLLKFKQESNIHLNNDIYSKEINLYKCSVNKQNKYHLNLIESCEDLKNQNIDKYKCKIFFYINSSFGKLAILKCLRNIYKKYFIKLKKKKVKNETIIYFRILTIKNKNFILKRTKKKIELKKLMNFQKEKKDTIYCNKLKKDRNLLNQKKVEKRKKKGTKKLSSIVKKNEYYNNDIYEKLNYKFSKILLRDCFTKLNTYNKNNENNPNNNICTTNKIKYIHNIKYNNVDNNFPKKNDENNLECCKTTVSNYCVNKDDNINIEYNNSNSYEKGNDNKNDKNNILNNENNSNKNYSKIFNVVSKFPNKNENIKKESFQQKKNKNEKSYNSEYIRMENLINNIVNLNKENKKSNKFMLVSNKDKYKVSQNTHNFKKVNNISKNENIKTSYSNDDNKIVCLKNNIHKNKNDKINVEGIKKLVEKVKLKKNKENAYIYLYGYKNLKFGEFVIELQALEENCKFFRKLNLSEKKKLTIKKEDIIKNYYNSLCINEKNEKIYKIINDSFNIENFLTFFTLIKIKNKVNTFLNEINCLILGINNLIIYIDKKLLEILNIMSNFESIKNRKNSSKFIIIKKFMNFFLNITNIYKDICTKVKSQGSIFSFIKFNYEIINNYLLFLNKFSNYISYNTKEIQDYYNQIKDINRNIKGVYLSNEQKNFFQNIYNKLADHLKNSYEKMLIFKKILDIYLIELKNIKKYQKEYTFNKVNILISSKCPYDLLIFSIIIQCKNLCEISIRNICNTFDFSNFRKEKNFYFLFLNKKIKTNFLKKIKKIVRNDVYIELKKILFYKELNRLMNNSLNIKTEEKSKLNKNYENNSDNKFFNNCLIGSFKDNQTNLENKNELIKVQMENKMKKFKCKIKEKIEKNTSFLSNVTTNNLYMCSSLSNYENIKYFEGVDQILKTNNTLSLVKNIRKSLNINSYSRFNYSSDEKEKLTEEKKDVNSSSFMKNKNINFKCDASKNFIMLTSPKRKEFFKNKINSLKNVFKNYELEAHSEMKNKNKKKNNIKKIVFRKDVNENNEKLCNSSVYNLKENVLKKNEYINQINLKKKNSSELLQDSKINKNNFVFFGEHKSDNCLNNDNVKLKLEKNNCEGKKQKIIENIENIKEIEKKYKRLKEIEKKEKLKKKLHELKLKKITKNNNIKILKNKALKTKKELYTSLVKKDINGFNTVIKFKINNDGHYESKNKKNQRTFLKNQTKNDFKSESYLVNKTKLENIFDKDSSNNSYKNLDNIDLNFKNINELNTLNNNYYDRPTYVNMFKSDVFCKRVLNDSNQNDIHNNYFNNVKEKSFKNEYEEIDKLNIFDKIIIKKKNKNLEKDDINILDNNTIQDVKKNEENVKNIYNMNFYKKIFQSKDFDKSINSRINLFNENNNTSIFGESKNVLSSRKIIKYKLSDYSEHLKNIQNNKFLSNKEYTDYAHNLKSDKDIKNMTKLELENYKKLNDFNYLNNKTPQDMKISKKNCELKNINEHQEKKTIQNYFKIENKIIPNTEDITKENKKIKNCDNFSKEKPNCKLDKKFIININLSKNENRISKENTRLINFQKDRNSSIRKNFLAKNVFTFSKYKTNESIERRQKIDKYTKELRNLASEKKVDRPIKNIKNIRSKIKKKYIIEELEKKKNNNIKNKEIYIDGYVFLSKKKS